MPDFITTARPYGQALFRLALETQKIELWNDRLERLAALTSDPQIEALLENPLVAPSQLADLFLSLAGENDTELNNFLQLLAENERFAALPEILKVFERLKRIQEGVRRIVITTAYPLEGPLLNDVLAQLEGHIGFKLEPTIEVDPSLIGGIKVSFTDRVIDLSIRGKLDAMAAALRN